jgi:hypothetical protein
LSWRIRLYARRIRFSVYKHVLSKTFFSNKASYIRTTRLIIPANIPTLYWWQRIKFPQIASETTRREQLYTTHHKLHSSETRSF